MGRPSQQLLSPLIEEADPDELLPDARQTSGRGPAAQHVQLDQSSAAVGQQCGQGSTAAASKRGVSTAHEQRGKRGERGIGEAAASPVETMMMKHVNVLQRKDEH
jgi:hypothetical protein